MNIKALTFGRRLRAVRLMVVASFVATFSPGSRSRLAAIPRTLVLLAAVSGMLLSSTFPAYAAGGQTGNVTGSVVDATTGAPIADAAIAVVAPSGTYKTTTDGKGFFSILGLNVDTYTISAQKTGYEVLSQAGVTIIGDQDLSLGTIKMTKVALRQIARVTARNISSAFQPNQTVDSVTVSGNRVSQTTGKSDSNDERALVQAVPGVTIDNQNNIVIRGSLSTEVGYQFDGIPYTEPFFSRNANAGFFSGLGSLQVVEGAGDATQGNSGGGTVNIVPKRGTYPGDGTLDVEMGGPNFNHALNFDYGFATANGRFSNYFSYSGERDVPYAGYANTNAASIGDYYGTSFETNDDIIDNFVFRFGKNNNQSLQALFQNRVAQFYGDRGGIDNQLYYNNDPGSYEAQGGYGYLVGALGPALGLKTYQNIIGINPGTPTSGTQFTNGLESPEQTGVDPTNLLKFEYTGSFGDNFLDVKAYNSFQFVNGATDTSAYAGNTLPAEETEGGQRTGIKADFIHQFGSKSTTTLDFSMENQHPIWNGYQSPVNILNEAAGLPGLNGASDPNLLADFVEPVGGVCPIVDGCGLAKYFPNGIPRVPIGGINYHGSDFLNFGGAIREQYSPTEKLKIDAGLRMDVEDYKFSPNPVDAGLPFALSDPSDVPLSGISGQYSKPSVLEPRLAVAYRIDPNDSIRASYGRSVIFLNAQTFGTPGSIYNYAPFQNVPATDTAASPGCGFSGGYMVVKCQNLAQQMFWAWDQNNDAPDLGNAKYEADTNYDFTFQHQFKNGFGMRLTPFYKNSTGVPDFSVLSSTVNPITGQLESFVFTVNNKGINKASGIEFGLTTPDKPYGFSGFFSATYQNVFDRVTPLTGGEDALPFIFDQSVALGDTYRAGYLSPFVARLGGDYKTKFGLEVRPILNFNRGYPFSLGTTAAANGFCGVTANVPAANFGCGTSFYPGYNGVTSGFSLTGQNAAAYVDPALPGNSNDPNIAATRGTPATSSTGGVLSKPELEADLDVEFHVGKGNRQTVGLLINNIFGNVDFGSVPQVNPYYQPVSTGVAGPQTGENALANPGYAGGLFSKTGSTSNVPALAYGDGPYILLPSTPTNFTLYYQLKL
jgi:hypothetical protein